MEQETLTITAEQANAIRKDCQEMIDLNNSLTNLFSNPDFKKVFLDHYVDKEPARLVHLLADPSIYMSDKSEMLKKDLHERMIGVARFSEYLRYIPMLAERAVKQLNDLNQVSIQ